MKISLVFVIILIESHCFPYGTDQHSNLQPLHFVTQFPDSGRQKAVQESAARESVPIQLDIKYGGLQSHVADFFNPKPIVDTIKEHEKYGNDGGKGRAISTSVVSVVEGLSNSLNALVDIPFQKTKTIGRQITESLNQVGGKLVGLA